MSPSVPSWRLGPLAAAIAAAGLLAAVPGIARAEDDLAAARATIEAANRDWVKAMQAGDAAAIAAPYADDAVFVLPDGRALVGRAAIEQAMAKGFAGGHASAAELRQEGLRRVAPDLIYEWGWGRTERVDAKGERKSGEGRYVTVWRRGPDGRWRIVRNLAL
jgi:uncharacterized protein (TIGR02246 family)